MNVSRKIIGIVGGMGPQAGLELNNLLIKYTPAKTDQEHLSVILASFPGLIDDRTLFLEGKTEYNPARGILSVIKTLANGGATVIGMACNTSYAPPILSVVEEGISQLKNPCTLVNMPAEVIDHIASSFPRGSRIGLMTSDGTFRSRLYWQLLKSKGFEPVVPADSFQHEIIHGMIYDSQVGIKSNPHGITPGARKMFDTAKSFFAREKASAVILGCTELSLIACQDENYGPVFIDSTACLARALIREATRPVEVSTPISN